MNDEQVDKIIKELRDIRGIMSKAYQLFWVASLLLLLIFIVNIFNNWMYYNGKRHSIIISKSINRLRTKSLIYLVFIQLLVYMLVIILSNAGI